jgi:hypothetical protein
MVVTISRSGPKKHTMENHMHQARKRPVQGGNLGTNPTLVPAPAPVSARMTASGDGTYDGGRRLSLLGGLFICHPVEETNQKTQTKALFDIEDVGTELDLMDPKIFLDDFFFSTDLILRFVLTTSSSWPTSEQVEEPSTGICPKCSNARPIVDHCVICDNRATSY